MTRVPNGEHPIRLNTVGLVEWQFDVYFLRLGVFHDVTDARPAASVIAANDTTSVGILDLDSVESVAVVGPWPHDGAANTTIKTAIALEETVVGCESLVNVFEELGTTHVTAPVGENSRPMVVKKVLKESVIGGGSIISVRRRHEHACIVIVLVRRS